MGVTFVMIILQLHLEKMGPGVRNRVQRPSEGKEGDIFLFKLTDLEILGLV